MIGDSHGGKGSSSSNSPETGVTVHARACRNRLLPDIQRYFRILICVVLSTSWASSDGLWRPRCVIPHSMVEVHSCLLRKRRRRINNATGNEMPSTWGRTSCIDDATSACILACLVAASTAVVHLDHCALHQIPAKDGLGPSGINRTFSFFCCQLELALAFIYCRSWILASAVSSIQNPGASSPFRSLPSFVVGQQASSSITTPEAFRSCFFSSIEILAARLIIQLT